MSADVTVVIPVYNRPTTVLETLASVARQPRAPAEVIIVDDGSTDGTAAAIDRWRATGTLACPVAVVRSAHRGAGAARNRGLGLVTTPWVAFLDSDDLWPDNFLERAAAALDAAESVIGATADRRHVDADGSTISIRSTAGLAENATRWLFENDGGIASASVLSTAAVRALGGFDESLSTGQDSALFQPLSLRGPWLHLPGEPVTYRHGLASRRGEMGNLSRKHGDRNRRWALIYERFITHHGGREALPREVYAPVLARRWFDAGVQLFRQGRERDARACFARSLRWDFRTSTVRKVAQLYLSSKAA
ncbi:MAG: glycosyltransferase [Pirellulaceae bacterium]|nr:glycosyltransferase [Pirellulaceae bacterium]